MGEGEVESIDDCQCRDNSSVSVVGGGVDLVKQERASAGVSLALGRTFQRILKSCKKRDQRACRRESLRGL